MPSESGLSRRSFFRLAGAAAGAAAVLPILTEGQLAHASQTIMNSKPKPAGAVLIDANENPLGPCAEAIDAMQRLLPQGGRYNADLGVKMVDLFAQQQGLAPEYIFPYAGSTDALTYAVAAFTSKDRPYVTADPGYESGMYTSAGIGTPVIKVPLTPDYKHDVKAMAAVPNAGLLYICSPNNPTGTITPREDIEYALANKPDGAIIMVDEAYIHFSDATPSIDLVKAGKDIIVLRTFSKIYGMAGLRCGLMMARPDLMAKVKGYSQNFIPMLASAAAYASLSNPELVPQRKKINAEIRGDVFEWLTAKGYSFVPSHSNFFMLDTKRPGKEVMAAMADKNVFIGRVWPAWPTYVRITVGTRPDMQKFQTAFHEVMNSSTSHLAHAELSTRSRQFIFS
ncbi:MAG TPA: pyridoxal phosphate-dependent aminotransferase [Acidisarcina sp.]